MLIVEAEWYREGTVDKMKHKQKAREVLNMFNNAIDGVKKAYNISQKCKAKLMARVLPYQQSLRAALGEANAAELARRCAP
jgi:MinD-like ATPase involved in chromosome partitioning or flagellar assembly